MTAGQNGHMPLTPRYVAADDRYDTMTYRRTGRSGLDLLALPNLDCRRLAQLWPELRQIRHDVAEQLEIDAKYRGYLGRQEGEIATLRRQDAMQLPSDLDYAGIVGQPGEAVAALTRARPLSLGDAARVPGVTPAAVTLLYRHARLAA